MCNAIRITNDLIKSGIHSYIEFVFFCMCKAHSQVFMKKKENESCI